MVAAPRAPGGRGRLTTGYAPGEGRPLAAYGVLTAGFFAAERHVAAQAIGDGTLVPEAEHDTGSGVLRVTDALALAPGARGHEIGLAVGAGTRHPRPVARRGIAAQLALAKLVRRLVP